MNVENSNKVSEALKELDKNPTPDFGFYMADWVSTTDLDYKGGEVNWRPVL